MSGVRTQLPFAYRIRTPATARKRTYTRKHAKDFSSEEASDRISAEDMLQCWTQVTDMLRF